MAGQLAVPPASPYSDGPCSPSPALLRLAVARQFPASSGPSAAELIALEDAHGAHNYHPLDVVVEEAKGEA